MPPLLNIITLNKTNAPIKRELAYFYLIKIIAMNEKFISRIADEVAAIEKAGLFKKERVITSQQGAEIIVGGKNVLNFCANNYLGLSLNIFSYLKI